MKKYLAAAAILLATCSFTFAQGAGGAGSAGGGGTGAGGTGTGGPGTGGTGGAGSGTGTGAPGTGAQGSLSGTGYMGGYTQTPWFADQNARQQLGISNDQFNQLNKAYTNYWRDFSNGANSTGANKQGNNGTGTGNTGTGTTGTGTNGTGNTGTGGNGVGANGTAGTGTDRTSPSQKSNATANFGQQTSKAAQDILKPEQYNRFRQMDYQYRGWNSFNDPEVQKQLNLTEKQRQQLQQYQRGWDKTMNQVYSSNEKNRDSAMKAYQDARQQYNTQMQQFLTPEQQRSWAQLTGDPYDFRPYWDQTKQPATPQTTQPQPK